MVCKACGGVTKCKVFTRVLASRSGGIEHMITHKSEEQSKVSKPRWVNQCIEYHVGGINHIVDVRLVP